MLEAGAAFISEVKIPTRGFAFPKGCAPTLSHLSLRERDRWSFIGEFHVVSSHSGF